MKISILIDTPSSWFHPYGSRLANLLRDNGHDVRAIARKEELPTGDVAFMLGCVRIVEHQYLQRNANNIVVHASDLPKGRGFSPLQWRVLDGSQRIVITLFEAVAEVDAGPWYIKDEIVLQGHELLSEMRDLLGHRIVDMCLEFVDRYPDVRASPQEGSPTFYRRRTIEDDRLDPDKTIAEQMNHFRIADNDQHPLYFDLLGNRYHLIIRKTSSDADKD